MLAVSLRNLDTSTRSTSSNPRDASASCATHPRKPARCPRPARYLASTHPTTSPQSSRLWTCPEGRRQYCARRTGRHWPSTSPTGPSSAIRPQIGRTRPAYLTAPLPAARNGEPRSSLRSPCARASVDFRHVRQRVPAAHETSLSCMRMLRNVGRHRSIHCMLNELRVCVLQPQASPAVQTSSPSHSSAVLGGEDHEGGREGNRQTRSIHHRRHERAESHATRPACPHVAERKPCGPGAASRTRPALGNPRRPAARRPAPNRREAPPSMPQAPAFRHRPHLAPPPAHAFQRRATDEDEASRARLCAQWPACVRGSASSHAPPSLDQGATLRASLSQSPRRMPAGR